MLQKIKKNRLIFENSIYLSISILIAKGSILGLFLIATRLLSQEQMGKYVFITNLLAILQPALNFGVQTYVPREVARDNNFVKSNFWNLVIIQEFIALVSLPIIYLILTIGSYDKDTINVVIAFLPLIFFFGPLYLIDSIFIGLEDAKNSARFQILLNIGILLFGVITLILTKNLIGLAISYLLAYIIILIFSSIVVFFRLKKFDAINFKWPVLKGLVIVLLPFVIVSFLDAIKNRVDVVILSNLVSYSELAIYGAAYRLFDGVRVLVSYPFSNATYPRMSALVARGKNRLSIFKEFSVIGGTLGFLASLALFILSDWIVKLLYPPEYLQAGIVLKLLSISILMDTVNAISGRFLFILEKPNIVSWGVLIAALTNISVNFLLIPSKGIMGAVIATDITYLVYTAFLIFNVRRLSPRIEKESITIQGISN